MAQTSTSHPPTAYMTLQWHVTNRCNWRCRHCYHDSYDGSELPLKDLKRIADDFVALTTKQGFMSNFVVTGGEPFIRTDFIDFLAHLNRHAKKIAQLTILTNGSLLTPAVLAELRQRVEIPLGFQISIEGAEEMNDAIRGKGAFAAILAAAARVKAAGIPLHLAATVSKLNHKHIFDLLDLLLTYDLSLVLRRFVPIGGGSERAALLTPAELRTIYKKAQALNLKYRLSTGGVIFETKTCTSGVQSLLWPPTSRHSTCGVRRKGIITLMPDGTIYPCRLLPVPLGNIQQMTFAEVFAGPYTAYTNAQQQESTCQTCSVYDNCHGGAPCISHAVKNNFYARDPQCWK